VQKRPFSWHLFSSDHHLSVESSKGNSSWSTTGTHAELIGKSGRIRQSRVRALHRPCVCDGDGASHPLASRELDRLAPHLHNLRDGSRRTQHPDSRVRASSGYGGAREHSCGSSCDLPSFYYAIHSSSTTSTLIPRPIQLAFPNGCEL